MSKAAFELTAIGDSLLQFLYDHGDVLGFGDQMELVENDIRLKAYAAVLEHGTEPFLNNAIAEAQDQMRRLRNDINQQAKEGYHDDDEPHTH